MGHQITKIVAPYVAREHVRLLLDVARGLRGGGELLEEGESLRGGGGHRLPAEIIRRPVLFELPLHEGEDIHLSKTPPRRIGHSFSIVLIPGFVVGL